MFEIKEDDNSSIVFSSRGQRFWGGACLLACFPLYSCEWNDNGDNVMCLNLWLFMGFLTNRKPFFFSSSSHLDSSGQYDIPPKLPLVKNNHTKSHTPQRDCYHPQDPCRVPRTCTDDATAGT